MKTNSTASSDKNSNRNRRCFACAAIGIIFAASQNSCSTAQSDAWAKIQNQGLIPYLVENQAANAPVESFGADSNRNFAEIASAPRTRKRTLVIAKPVIGKPGFVYSPHMPGNLEIDVTDYQPGERVRCPYTKKSFVIPRESRSILETSRVAATRPPIARTPQTQPVTAPQVEKRVALTDPRIVAPKNLEEPVVVPIEDIEPEPQPMRVAAGPDKIPSSSDILELPKKEGVGNTPTGKWVPGKPNYVYSPFAASNQVVDVEGYDPGTEVKCPYTGKIFEVPARD